MKKLLERWTSPRDVLKKNVPSSRDAAFLGEIKRLNTRIDQLSKDNARLTRALTETYIARIDE